MAGESSVERLAKLSLPAKLGILAGVLLVLGLVYYNFFYTDMVDEQKGLVATKKRQIEDERRLVKRKAEYQDLLRQKARALEAEGLGTAVFLSRELSATVRSGRTRTGMK